MKKNVSDLPVMKNYCKTCPFKPKKNGVWQNVELANEVISRNLFKGQQICHGTEGPKREPRNRCKGSFENNEQIYIRIFGFGFEQWKKQQNNNNAQI